MKANEILLKHLTEGRSERVKKFMQLVDHSKVIAAMEEYAQKSKLLIEFNEYCTTCGDGCCTNYGTVVKVNGVEMPFHNQDTRTVVEEILQHLGYEVEIIETYNGE